MRWSTPWRVLVGDRGAILEAAASRGTLLVGAILVLSASLARKYDTVDLLDQPLELLHGFAATIVNTLALHSLIWLFAAGPKRPPFVSSLLSFLGIFWLAAPMGWLYGIPYEQFMSAPDAVSANLWTLAAISVIRVVWVTRVLNVLWGVQTFRRGIRLFFVVMLYSDAVAIVALTTMPLPTVDLMGGLQQPPEIRIVADTALLAGIIAVFSAPIWLFGGLAVLASGGNVWTLTPAESRDGAAAAPTTRVPPAIWPALAALAFWLSWLPIMQPPQQRKTRIESLMNSGQITRAIHELCWHQRSEYPPVWTLPPVNEDGHAPESNSLPAIARALDAEPQAPRWVVEIYGKKLVRYVTTSFMYPRRGESILNVHYAKANLEIPGPSNLNELLNCMRFIQTRVETLTEGERAYLAEWIKEVMEIGWKHGKPEHP